MKLRYNHTVIGVATIMKMFQCLQCFKNKKTKKKVLSSNNKMGMSQYKSLTANIFPPVFYRKKYSYYAFLFSAACFGNS